MRIAPPGSIGRGGSGGAASDEFVATPSPPLSRAAPLLPPPPAPGTPRSARREAAAAAAAEEAAPSQPPAPLARAAPAPPPPPPAPAPPLPRVFVRESYAAVFVADRPGEAAFKPARCGCTGSIDAAAAAAPSPPSPRPPTTLLLTGTAVRCADAVAPPGAPPPVFVPHASSRAAAASARCAPNPRAARTDPSFLAATSPVALAVAVPASPAPSGRGAQNTRLGTYRVCAPLLPPPLVAALSSSPFVVPFATGASFTLRLAPPPRHPLRDVVASLWPGDAFGSACSPSVLGASPRGAWCPRRAHFEWRLASLGGPVRLRLRGDAAPQLSHGGQHAPAPGPPRARVTATVDGLASQLAPSWGDSGGGSGGGGAPPADVACRTDVVVYAFTNVADATRGRPFCDGDGDDAPSASGDEAAQPAEVGAQRAWGAPAEFSPFSAPTHAAPKPPKRRAAGVLYDFYAVEEGELSVRRGDELLVIERAGGADGWALVRRGNGEEGLVPASHLDEEADPRAI